MLGGFTFCSVLIISGPLKAGYYTFLQEVGRHFTGRRSTRGSSLQVKQSIINPLLHSFPLFDK